MAGVLPDDIAGTAMSSIIGINNIYLLVSLGAVMVGLIVLYVYIDKRYPKGMFHVLDGNHEAHVTIRLLGDKILPDDLFRVFLQGRDMIGEDIKKFSYAFSGGKKFYRAYAIGKTWLPVHVEQEYQSELMTWLMQVRDMDDIEVIKAELDRKAEEVRGPAYFIKMEKMALARDISNDFVNLQRTMREEKAEQQNIMAILAANIPLIALGVIVLIAGVLAFGQGSAMANTLLQVSASQQQITGELANVTAQLAQLAVKR